MLTVPQTLVHGVTAPSRIFEVALADGATICVRAYGNGPRLVMSHGNGLAIEAYRPFWSLLLDRYEVVMFDFRHHGLASPYRGPMRNWPTFIADFGTIHAGIERVIGPADSIGVFHSLSSLTALLHTAAQSVTQCVSWRGLMAFEPPCPPPAGHPEFEPFWGMHRKLAEGAERRRPVFQSVEDLAASFARVGSFRRMNAATRHALAAATLRHDAANRRYELACAREFESETFRLRNLEGAWQRIGTISLPVGIVAGI